MTRVTFEGSGVVEQPWAYIATLRDPDGNRLMLRESRQAPVSR